MYTTNLPRKNILSPNPIIAKAFPGISQLEIDELVTRSQAKTYPANTVLCLEGRQESKFCKFCESVKNSR